MFDAQRRLAYHGRFDESTPRNGKSITGACPARRNCFVACGDLLVACRLCVAGLCPHAQQCCHTHTYSHHGRKLRAEVQLPYTLMLLG